MRTPFGLAWRDCKRDFALLFESRRNQYDGLSDLSAYAIAIPRAALSSSYSL